MTDFISNFAIAFLAGATTVYIINGIVQARRRAHIKAHPVVGERIYWVVAGTPSQSEAMRRELLVPPRFWRDVGWKGEHLRGHTLHPGDVIFVGTWDERDDLDDVTMQVHLATRLP